MKFIFVLVFSVLITVSIGTLAKNKKTQKQFELISPLVVGTNTAINGPSSEITTRDSIFGWQVFVNNYNGYKIKHPSNVSLKNKRNGDIELQKQESISLSITQEVLANNDTINTVMEKAIDKKMIELKDRFLMVNAISPIALGLVTAQTYGSMENGESVTFYYIPQDDKKYLLVTNKTPASAHADYLTSEDIIYSIEFLP